MASNNYLCANKTIKRQVCEKVLEEKNDFSTTNMDINNKNLINNDNLSNNKVIITKTKKMNEYENIKSEKVIESIKSLYILKDIFSFLSEKRKLKILLYNKYFQKKLDINIKDYKRISKRLREGERNGKGKEYNIYGKLIFEGEYINEKRCKRKLLL